MYSKETNCKSENVIYLSEYTLCSKQYIGQLEWPFTFGTNGYRHKTESTDSDKQFPVEQNFRPGNHNFFIHA